MLEFLYTITIQPIEVGYHDIIRGDWGFGMIGIFISLLMISIMLLLIVGIFSLMYEAIDKSGRTTTTLGTIVRTRFVPAHVTTIYNAATKTQTPIFHPDRWYAAFRVNETIEELHIDKYLYAKLSQGDQMRLLITTGKLSKRTRIVGFAV